MNKIGIIGGTFNPIHNAHLLIAEQFYEQLGLDKCFFVPSFLSPFKVNSEERLISAEIRLEMVKLALGNNPHFIIDTYEIEKGGVSFSIDTINYFYEKFNNSELYYIIGQDQANSFTKWKNWEDIVEKVQLVIAKRIDDTQFPTRKRDKITNELTIENKPPIWISNTNMEISSKEIRDRIKKGKSTNYLLPDSVYDYIKENNLYK